MANYTKYSDKQLTDLLKNRDHLAFTEIYNRYWRKLLMIAWNHSKENSASKDLVHEVFMSLWERDQKIEIENLAAFLATAMRLSLFQYYQKEQRRVELAKANYLFSELNDEEEKLDALFLKEYINGIVEEMPEKCKLVFRYSRELGLKNSEIAEKINISEKGVEASLTRALKILKWKLKGYGTVIFVAVIYYLSSFK
ncbi:sigma-70 family RNA polymerase sigma factor [Pedobacter sp. GR22-6]|uniref:sigma-70 family RNA polymerase sigma factor n=1 Tax=Pedobacter sp. GR22-6 TaxID=3127957 RepID=UPI00307EF0D2